jgi:hypothetical protein
VGGWSRTQDHGPSGSGNDSIGGVGAQLIANGGPSPVVTHLLIIVRALSGQVSLENASGKTRSGDPYIRVFLRDGVLAPDHSIRQPLIFTGQGGNNATPVAYVLDFLSGQGNP